MRRSSCTSSPRRRATAATSLDDHARRPESDDTRTHVKLPRQRLPAPAAGPTEEAGRAPQGPGRGRTRETGDLVVRKVPALADPARARVPADREAVEPDQDRRP